MIDPGGRSHPLSGGADEAPAGVPGDGPRRPPPFARGRSRWVGLLAAVALTAIAVVLVLRAMRMLRPTSEEIRGAVYAAIQRESAETFLVTGFVDLTATTTVRNTKRLLPGIIGLNLGTTSATVRMPGRVSYGVDLAGFRLEHIRIGPDTSVTVTVSPPAVWAIEPVLEDMEVETDVGWARLYSRSGRQVEQEAIRLMETALRAQGEAHLRDSDQPRRNTARAVQGILGPTLAAAGVHAPRIVVLFSDRPSIPTEVIE
ncbi:MAG: DUF4230 domain-containing protein [Gemmatimonadota bacterium]